MTGTELHKGWLQWNGQLTSYINVNLKKSNDLN